MDRINRIVNELLKEENSSHLYKKKYLFDYVETELNGLFMEIRDKDEDLEYRYEWTHYTVNFADLRTQKEEQRVDWIKDFNCYISIEKNRFYLMPEDLFELVEFDVLTEDILGGTVFEDFLYGKDEISIPDDVDIEREELKVAANIAKKLLKELEEVEKEDEDFRFGKKSYERIVNFVKENS